MNGSESGVRPAGSPRAAGLVLVVAIVLAGCVAPGERSRPPAYRPQAREITVTTVPLLVKESARTFPFLARDFAKGGVLEGHEVYGFSPSTIAAVEGDTLHFSLINPEDDLHTFVLPDLAVPLPGQSVTRATYVARRAGIYPVSCNVPTHAPMMWGQLVVLSPRAFADGGGR